MNKIWVQEDKKEIVFSQHSRYTWQYTQYHMKYVE